MIPGLLPAIESALPHRELHMLPLRGKSQCKPCLHISQMYRIPWLIQRIERWSKTLTYQPLTKWVFPECCSFLACRDPSPILVLILGTQSPPLLGIPPSWEMANVGHHTLLQLFFLNSYCSSARQPASFPATCSHLSQLTCDRLQPWLQPPSQW